MSDPADTTDLTAVDARRRLPRVVVGVDGSPGSRAALVHAFTAAARRGAELEILSTFTLQGVWIGGYPLGVPAVATIRANTEDRVRTLVDEVRDDEAVRSVPGAADVRAVIVVSSGHAAQRLVDASGAADLVVVGSRGAGSRTERGPRLRGAAVCGALEVSGRRRPARRGGHVPGPSVLVGVDGSEAARAALRVAVEEAARLGTDVAAVTTYEMADHWMDLSTVIVPTRDEVRWQLEQAAEAMVEDVLSEYRARSGGVAPATRVMVTEGPAADVLIRLAADAALLVVGSRGSGEFRGLLVGSVALACAMHATGPVMVVHPESGRVSVETAQRATAGA